MKYVYWGIGIIIFAIASLILNIIYNENPILKIINIGLIMHAIIIGILTIKNGFKIIKLERQINVL